MLRLLTIIIAFVCFTLAAMRPGSAAVIKRFNTIAKGASITHTGNTLALSQAPRLFDDIGALITDNTALQAGPAYPFGTTLNWQQDSSTAILSLPPGATVLYAELLWSYTSVGVNGVVPNPAAAAMQPVNFSGPFGANLVTPDPTTAVDTPDPSAPRRIYSTRSAIVTNLVSAQPNQPYQVGAVPAVIDLNDSGTAVGWSLIVVYTNPTIGSLRDVNLFVGNEAVGAGQNGAVVNISGFKVPTAGPVSAHISISTLEGDSNKGGDQFRFFGSTVPVTTLSGANALAGPNNQIGNFFASQINYGNPPDPGLPASGTINPTGTFGTLNQPVGSLAPARRQGWDITNVDASAQLHNGDTNAAFQGTTSGDAYVITVTGVQIDVFQPTLQIAKTSNGPWVSGQTAPAPTYTLSVTNAGTAPTVGASTVLDQLPAGITADTTAPPFSAAENGWTCTVSATQLLTCTHPAVIPNTAPANAVPFTVPILVGAAAAGTVTNYASVGAGGDPSNGGAPPPPGPGCTDPTHCANVPTQILTREAQVIKSAQLTTDLDGNGLPTAGDALTWTIALANTGTAPLVNAALTDALPANTTIVPGSVTVVSQSGTTPAAQPNPAYDGAANQNLLLSPGATIAPGGNIVASFRVTINAGFHGILSNQANADATGLTTARSSAADSTTTGLPPGITVPAGSLPQGPNFTPNTGPPIPGPVNVNVVSPELTLLKSVALTNDIVGNGQPAPGDTLTWTISYANTGDAPLPAAQIADALPANTTYVAGSARIVSQTGTTPAATANAAFNGVANQTLIGNAVTVANGGVVTVSFSATIDAGFSGTLANRATGTGTGLPPAGVPSRATDSTTTGIPTGVVVPPGSIPQGPGGTDNLGEPINRETLVIVTPPHATVIKSVALTTDVVGNGVPAPGDTLTWRVALANDASAPVPVARLTDTLPANTTFVPGSVTIVSSTGATPPAAANPAFNGVGNTALLATPVFLARRGVVVVTFQTTINAGFSGRLANTANATGGGLPPGGVNSSAADASTTDLPAGVTVPAGSLPQGADGSPNTGPPISGPTTVNVPTPTENFYKSVALTTDTVGNGVPSPGDTLTYTITGENTGSVSIPAAQIADTLPANTTIVAGSAKIVSQSGTTPAATANAAFNGTTVTTLIGNTVTLLPAGVITVSFAVTIDAGFSGTLNNRATATGRNLPAGGIPSAAVDNTTSGLDITVPPDSIPQGPGGTPNQGPPISGPTKVIVTPPTAAVIKSVQLTTDLTGIGVPAPGDTLTWEVALANTERVPIPNVQLTDTLPANTAIVAGSATIVSQTGTTPAAAANTAFDGAAVKTLLAPGVRLAPEGNVVVSFRVTINAGFTGTLTNLATATGNGLPPAGVPSSAADGTTTGLPPGITVPATSLGQGPGGTPNRGSPLPGPTKAIVVAPGARVIKSVRLLTDANNNGVPTPGDTLAWTISYANTGNVPIPASQITDTLPANTTIVAGSASLVGATGANPAPVANNGFNGATSTNLLAATFTLDPGGVVTVAYDVTINAGFSGTLLDRAVATGNGLPAGGSSSFAADNATTGLPAGVTIPTGSLPQGPGGAPNAGPPIDGPTRAVVVLPNAFGIKTVQLTTDVSGSGVVQPGDTLTWTMAYENTGTAPLPGTQITDALPTNSTLVAGSATLVSSTGVTGPAPVANTAFNGTTNKALLVTPITLAPGGTLVVSFRATINAGVTTPATNRSVLNGNGLPPAGILSDAADNSTTGIPTGLVVPPRSLPQGPNGTPNTGPPLNAPTFATPVTAAAAVVKSVKLTTDVNGTGVPAPGDTLTWTVSYANTGSAPLPSAELTDAPGPGLTVVPGSATLVSQTGVAPPVIVNPAFNGTTSTSLISDVVGVSPGGQITISFRTTINAGTSGTLNNSAVGTGRGLPAGGVPSAAADSSTTGLPPGVVVPPGSIPQGPNGQPNTGPPIPGPTHVTESLPTAAGVKSVQLATDLAGNGVLTDGDTLAWTITYVNTSAVAIPKAQITDTIDPNTTLVKGSETVVASTGVSPAPVANTAFDGSATKNLLVAPVTIAPSGSITVSFRATLNAGVTTQVTNRALLNGTGLPAAGIPTSAADNSTTGLPAGVVIPPGSLPQGPGGKPNSGPPLGAPTFATPQAVSAAGVKSAAITGGPPNARGGAPGDVVTWTIAYANTGAAPIPNAQITDALPLNTTFVRNSVAVASASGVTPAPGANGAYDGVLSKNLLAAPVTLAPRALIVLHFSVTINPGFTGTITNRATLTGNGLPSAGIPTGAADNSTTGLPPGFTIPGGSAPQGPSGAPNTGTPVNGPTVVTSTAPALSPLLVQKTVDRPVAASGDRLIYTIVVNNPNPIALGLTTIVDSLPGGVAYANGSTRIDGAPVPDPLKAGSTLSWSVPSTAPRGQHTVIFAAVIAPGIPVDTVLTNTANANAKVPGTTTTLVSGNAQAQTRVIGGIFNNCVTIVGRVFTNRDNSGRFGRDDIGIPDVRVYTETGQYVVTDRYGKYDFPCIRPGMHVLRLDTTTLPPGTAPYDVRNYDDPRSVIRLAHGTLDAGLIQNINFAIRGAP